MMLKKNNFDRKFFSKIGGKPIDLHKSHVLEFRMINLNFFGVSVSSNSNLVDNSCFLLEWLKYYSIRIRKQNDDVYVIDFDFFLRTKKKKIVVGDGNFDNLLLCQTKHHQKKKLSSLFGTYRSILHNAVAGTLKKFELIIRNSLSDNIKAIGLKFIDESDSIVVYANRSHIFKHKKKCYIEYIVEKKHTVLRLKCSDKQILGAEAAKFVLYRPLNVFTGKGFNIQGKFYHTKLKK